MSKESLPQTNYDNNEIDLLSLFNYIGNKINKLIAFISSIFKWIFSIFIYASQAIVRNIKLIAVVLVASGILGFGLQTLQTRTYDSKMLVKTYFDAKYQLATYLNYYNVLLEEEKYDQLAKIFEVSAEEIKQIIAFEMLPGPETENDKLVEYVEFIKSIDSTRADDISLKEFIDNRDIFSRNVFEIRVETTQNDMFTSIETGIYKSFENLYSKEKKKIRDSMLSIRRSNILNSITEIDSLQKVYIKVLEEESKTAKLSLNLSGGMPLQLEKTSTNELELLNKEIQLRDNLRKLEEEKVEEDVFYEVISNFQEVGNEVKDITKMYALIFPLLSFLILSVGFLLKKFTKFVNSYEA